MKIPECVHCVFYSHNPHLVCAIHPNGVATDHCLDFKPNSNIEEEELWAPEGYSWHGDELIPNRTLN